jgi:hypothetical protein
MTIAVTAEACLVLTWTQNHVPERHFRLSEKGNIKDSDEQDELYSSIACNDPHEDWISFIFKLVSWTLGSSAPILTVLSTNWSFWTMFETGCIHISDSQPISLKSLSNFLVVVYQESSSLHTSCPLHFIYISDHVVTMRVMSVLYKPWNVLWYSPHLQALPFIANMSMLNAVATRDSLSRAFLPYFQETTHIFPQF